MSTVTVNFDQNCVIAKIGLLAHISLYQKDAFQEMLAKLVDRKKTNNDPFGILFKRITLMAISLQAIKIKVPPFFGK